VNTKFMEHHGFPAWLRTLVPCQSFKPPEDTKWPSGWEGGEELASIDCTKDNLPKLTNLLNSLLIAEEQAERGEVSDAMKAMLELVDGPPPAPTSS
jgi:hypothetical protein